MGSVRNTINRFCCVYNVGVFCLLLDFFLSFRPLRVTDLMEFALHFRSFKRGLKIRANVVVNGNLVSAISTALTWKTVMQPELSRFRLNV